MIPGSSRGHQQLLRVGVSKPVTPVFLRVGGASKSVVFYEKAAKHPLEGASMCYNYFSKCLASCPSIAVSCSVYCIWKDSFVLLCFKRSGLVCCIGDHEFFVCFIVSLFLIMLLGLVMHDLIFEMIKLIVGYKWGVSGAATKTAKTRKTTVSPKRPA